MDKKEIIIDIDTGDPDDFLALLLFLGHPAVCVKAVTVSPGSEEQIGLIHKALNWFDLKVPVGAFNINHDKKQVSDWYIYTFGKIKPSRDAYTAPNLLCEVATRDTSVFCGTTLKNVALAIKYGHDENIPFKIREITIQGGFAGANLVPENKLPDNFKGKTTAHSNNLESDKKSAWAVIRSNLTPVKRLVSENITQQIMFTPELNEAIGPLKKHNLAIALIWKAMDRYYARHKKSKKVGNLFTACCAINPEIAVWKEVEILRENHGWGANPSGSTGCFISVDHDSDQFAKTLMAY